MADPVIAGGIRAQVILHGRSGLPEDRFVTTWAFTTPSGTVEELHHQQVGEMLEAFWTGASTTGQTLTGNMGGQFERGIGAGTIKTYDLGVPAGQRTPVERAFEVKGGAPSASLPAEVAICASFHGENPGPRTRGRVYIGPMSTTTASQRTDGSVEVSTIMRTLVREAMQRLAAFAHPEYPTWCVLSQASGDMVPVVGGWVDDAFDTQRRRGLAATTRSVWSL